MKPRQDGSGIPSRRVLGIRVDAVTYPVVVQRTLEWAHARQSRYVCIATVNNVVEAHESGEFRDIMDSADIVTPDGMPLVWGLRLLGVACATRVYGPDLTVLLLRAAEQYGLPVAFYGSTGVVLQRLLATVRKRFPKIQIAYASSPPFRQPTAAENEQTARDINGSGAAIVLVGLSTPKQERWMAVQNGQIRAPMLGVGAAFDFVAGTKPQAPRWMMRIGMEWFFRLATEPRRLWKRYLKQNPRFVFLFTLQVLGIRCFDRGAGPARP